MNPLTAPSSNLKPRSLVAGWDPGQDQTLAILDPDPALRPDPTIPVTPVVALIDLPHDGDDLADILTEWSPYLSLVVLEDNGPRPTFNPKTKKTQGAASQWKFAQSCAKAEQALRSARAHLRFSLPCIRHFQIHLSPPQIWKSRMGLSRNKDESLNLARRIHPVPRDLKLKKHHNRAESILLAWYGVTKLTHLND